MIGLAKCSPVDRRIAIEGQSNAEGYSPRSGIATLSDTTLAAFDSGTFDRVYIFNPGTGNYERLKMGVNNRALNGSSFGPEFGLAVRWMRETVRGNLYIDKHAAGGQPISYFAEGTSVFTTLLTNTAGQNAWLTANKRRPAHMGWLWAHGEANNGDSAASYEAALTAYVNSRLNNTLMPVNAFRVLVQMTPGSVLYGAGVTAAKTSYANANPTTARTIPMGELGSDNIHSSAKGCVNLAFAAYSILFSRPALALA